MIFKQRHILRMAFLAIPLCFIVSAVGMTQDKTEGLEEGAESREYIRTSEFGFVEAPQTKRLVQGKNIMISWSKDNDELRGFSQKTGDWTILKIEKQEKLNPTVSNDVAAVRVGDTMAAYSGTTGTWDVLKLSKNSKAQPLVAALYVQTIDNDYLYIFAAAKGKWTSPNDPDFRPSKSEYRPGLGVVTPVLPGGIPNEQRALYEKMSGYGTDYEPYEHPPEPLDAQTIQLARKFRGKGLDNNEARKALTEAVGKAFDYRQKHQKSEASRLAEKLKKIQEAIEKRESLREKIIQRRVDELLDPNVDWESAFPRGASPSPFGSGMTPGYPGTGASGSSTP